jgi:hypothetical protein
MNNTYKRLGVLVIGLLFAVAPFLVFAGPPVEIYNGGGDAGLVSPGDVTSGCILKATVKVGDTEFSPGTPIPGSRDDWGLVCMVGTIQYIVNWVFYIIMIIVMVMVLYGAFTFLTSSGDPTKTGKATKIITFAVIGMVVALLARAIPQAVKYITGMG